MSFHFVFMVKRTGPTNIYLRKLIDLLNSQKSAFWKAVALNLSRPSRIRRAVNLSRISRLTKPRETILVPGKVLATGELKHPLTIIALSFSSSAVDKVNNAKASIMSINELLEKNKTGKGVRIFG